MSSSGLTLEEAQDKIYAHVSSSHQRPACVKTLIHSSKNYCLYCGLGYVHISTHLETKHKHEEDVKEFSALPIGSKARKKLISVIRQKGNFLRNKKSIAVGGVVKVCRQSKAAPDTYMNCEACKKAIRRRNFSQHLCNESKPSKDTKNISILPKPGMTDAAYALAVTFRDDAVGRWLL